MTDPLGQSQVLPYLKGLSKNGYNFHLISFEKPDRFKAHESTIKNICKDANIEWHPMSYTKRPPVFSTLWDVRKMKSLALTLHKQHRFELIHCRSYLSALVGLHFKRRLQVPFLFDMRGFWADERIDGKIWELKNPLYRTIYNFFKKKEKQFFRESDHIISLTYNGKEEILGNICPELSEQKITVIPCCVDLELFNPKKIKSEEQQQLKNKLGINENEYILGYVGSIGTWYMLPEMLQQFKAIKKTTENARFLFVTGEPKETIYEEATKNGIQSSDLIITSCLHKEVPLHVSLFNTGIFFIRPTFSKKASSPTKQGEIMAMGIPLICNAGVGDTDRIVRNYSAGIVIDDLNNMSEEIIELMKHSFDPAKTMHGASEFFGLNVGVKRYLSVYHHLTQD
jgi:glycosyltransferase involved in cell wall biosynthesis